MNSVNIRRTTELKQGSSQKQKMRGLLKGIAKHVGLNRNTKKTSLGDEDIPFDTQEIEQYAKKVVAFSSYYNAAATPYQSGMNIPWGPEGVLGPPSTYPST